MKNFLKTFVVCSLMSLAAFAQKGPVLPTDAKNLVERIEGCVHWSGEEGYNDGRKQEIADNLAKLKCESLEKDTAAIKVKYKKNKVVLAAIVAAENPY